jgi:uncharacterized protein YggU (UPF0235/DUF167 family)
MLSVHVSARSRRNAVTGVRNGALRVEVTQVPEKGKANAAVISLLSRVLDLPKSAFLLTSGETSRNKRFLIAADHVEQLRRMLRQFLTEDGSGE